MDESVTDAAAAEAAAAAAGGFALQRQEELSQDDREELQAIEVYFHGLIYERNGGAARLDPLLAQNNYQLPSLVEHVKAYDDNSAASTRRLRHHRVKRQRVDAYVNFLDSRSRRCRSRPSSITGTCPTHLCTVSLTTNSQSEQAHEVTANVGVVKVNYEIPW